MVAGVGKKGQVDRLELDELVESLFRFIASDFFGEAPPFEKEYGGNRLDAVASGQRTALVIVD